MGCHVSGKKELMADVATMPISKTIYEYWQQKRAMVLIRHFQASRALVSKKKVSQLCGEENSNSVELKNKSVPVDIGST
ncbi:hypothetical protein S245_019261 [Arachis hypogaea]